MSFTAVNSYGMKRMITYHCISIKLKGLLSISTGILWKQNLFTKTFLELNSSYTHESSAAVHTSRISDIDEVISPTTCSLKIHGGQCFKAHKGQSRPLKIWIPDSKVSGKALRDTWSIRTNSHRSQCSHGKKHILQKSNTLSQAEIEERVENLFSGEENSEMPKFQNQICPTDANISYNVAAHEMSHASQRGDKKLEMGTAQQSHEARDILRARAQQEESDTIEDRTGARHSADLHSPEHNSNFKVTENLSLSTKPWQAQKSALLKKFGSIGWFPRKRLSPDALDGIRDLHFQYPEKYTTSVLADHFQISPEAIRRIIKSKWRANETQKDARRKRWNKRGECIWGQMVEIGIKPPKRWREMR